jgi:L-malate glycosyltransferase
MKIIFLGNALAEHLRRWSRFFVALGHEVHVITWNSRILDGYEPVVVHQLQKVSSDSGVFGRAANLLRLRSQVRRLIREIQPDLIHAHTVSSYAWVAMLSGFHPLLVSPWGDDVLIDIHHSKVERYFTVRTLKRADLVHCDGENTKEAVVRLGVVPENVVILRFGVDVKKFAPATPTAEFLDRYGLRGSKVVVSTRTLNPIHNVESVLRAAALAIPRCPTLRLLVVGGGAEEQALRALAQSLGIAGNVAFTGHVEEHEMVACLQAADVYVSTSISESGLASSTAEAMACGLPVINTDTGDIRLWIEDGKGGYVVPVKSPEAVADKITHLLEHDDERRHSGAVNRKTIEERYNVYVEMKKMEKVYLDVVAGRKAK